uniref:Structure-specific endonuclease subunit SLX4 n=1 Tax=Lepeophtheirus salmonis TaxID=72036 RepID=A0A0K2UCZ4_LEPSM
MSRLSRKNSKIFESLNDSSEDFAPPSNPIKHLPITNIFVEKPPEEKKTRKVQKKKDRTIKGGQDPNLELAVALSASLNPKKDVMLPGAAAWSAPKNKLAKTPLELRSSEERSRLIAEKVSTILDETSCTTRLSLYPPLPKLKLKSQRLCNARNAKHPVWDLASQKLRACSRYYVPNLLMADKKGSNVSELNEEQSNLSLLSDNFITLINDSHDSDLSIYVKGDKIIHAHSIIFYCRYPSVLKDVTLEGDNKLIVWPEVYFHSALSFLRFVYGGVLPEMLSTISELRGLTILAKKYKIKVLEVFLKSVDEKSLIDDSDELHSTDSEIVSATQNLTDLIDALERENEDVIENNEEEENQKNLSDIQDFILSQPISNSINPMETPQVDVRSSSTVELFEEIEKSFLCAQAESSETVIINNKDINIFEKDEEIKEDMIDLTQESDNSEHSNKKSYFFEDEEDIFAIDEPDVSRKRKSVSSESFSKLSKVECSTGFETDQDNNIDSRSDVDEISLPTPSKNDSIWDFSEVEVVSPNLIDKSIEFDESSTLPDESSTLPDEISTLPDEISTLPERSSVSAFSISSDQEFHTPKSSFCNREKKDLILPSPKPHDKTLSPPNLSNESDSNQHYKYSSQKLNVTPMLEYESMLSPALRCELKKFGLKVVPRAKACRLLEYIYEETHKEAMYLKEDKVRKEEREEECIPTSSQTSMNSSFEDMAEESIHFHSEEAYEEAISQAPLNLEEKVKNFIRSDSMLWNQVLRYEPIWLEDFVSAFKSSDKGEKKCKENQISDILDSECITFRTRKSATRNSPKKNRQKLSKKSPLKSSAI